ncbi:MAG TPA: surface-adhesin E family protein [Gemmatimonadaceae bacterium]
MRILIAFAAALAAALVLLIAGVISYTATTPKQRSFTFDAPRAMVAQNGLPRVAWMPVYAADRGDTVSIDTGTYYYQPGGRTFTLWTRFVFGDSGKLSKDSAGHDVLVRYAFLHDQFDCTARRVRMTRLHFYDFKYHLALTEKYDPEMQAWDTPDTGSIGGDLVREACARAPQPPKGW